MSNNDIGYTQNIIQYLKDEISKENFNAEVIEIDMKKEDRFLPPVELTKEVKDKIKSKTIGETFTYVVVNKNNIDNQCKIIYSNGLNHLVYDTYGSRLTYFDSDFNYSYEATDILGQTSTEGSISGIGFSIFRNLNFSFDFKTEQFKKIGLEVYRDKKNEFNISTEGKNKVKTIAFDYDKKQIKASVVNCFIKNIIFDLDGNILSIGIKNKISKDMLLKKTQFDVNSYQQLINLINMELEVYNLMNDSNINIIDQKTFDSQIFLIRTVIKEKENIDNEKIYKHLDSIRYYFKNTKLDCHNFRSIEKEIVPIITNTKYSKYLNYEDNDIYKKLDFTIQYLNNKKLDFYHSSNGGSHLIPDITNIKFSANCTQKDKDYYYIKQVLVFLATLKHNNQTFEIFFNTEVISSFQYLNKISSNFKEKFNLKNNKDNKSIFDK